MLVTSGVLGEHLQCIWLTVFKFVQNNHFKDDQNMEVASHADVLWGSSRIPAPRTSAEMNSHFRLSANCLCLNRPISVDSL